MKTSVESLKGATSNLLIPLPIHLLPKGIASDLVWPEVSKDLIEVACAVFLADRMHLRPRNTLGSRRIALRLPVRKPGVWKRAAPYLEQAISVLSDDLVTFDFYRSPNGAGCFTVQDARKLRSHKTAPNGTYAGLVIERVALFSGGLDSVAAAAYFARHKQPTAYVTHYARDIRRIEVLLNKIYRVYGKGVQPPHAQFYIKPKSIAGPFLREHSRRNRSFLFVSLALATAFALKAHEVCVCENGVIALNLPFDATMIPTRHAHSSFLLSMERLGKTLFDQQIRVFNPFELCTKGEMSRIFRRHPELALESVSCWNQQWSGRGANYGKGHCGYCVPCLVRRASLDAANIRIPKGHFDLDVNRLSQRQRLAKRDSVHLEFYRALLSFTSRIGEYRSWKSFLRGFPDIITSEPTTTPQPPEEWFKSLFTMMKRFAGEVEHAFVRSVEI